MALEHAIFAAMSGVSGLSGHVYTAEALRSDTADFAFYRMLSYDEEAVLDGETNLHHMGAEIHAVAHRQAGVITMGKALRTALKALQGRTVSGVEIQQVKITMRSPDLWETLVDLYRRMYIVEFWYREV